eukprot:CAMPEP_0175140250 /NCGR_PEP_ID=MMETSP0087-20121206/11361_1 /TAXON_ID=136419 /ORGANISM="Unknown Unknown, Strain D1" /LENGTH=453 /DNA_ID=CAMNT_0016423365 /DNA_START=317 /DNA_END=1678 /DNA_ORIENTATION=-
MYPDAAISHLNIHRLVLASFVSACKLWDDDFQTNATYAAIGGVPLCELNQMEARFLCLLGFDLGITSADYASYKDRLLAHRKIDLRLTPSPCFAHLAAKRSRAHHPVESSQAPQADLQSSLSLKADGTSLIFSCQIHAPTLPALGADVASSKENKRKMNERASSHSGAPKVVSPTFVFQVEDLADGGFRHSDFAVQTRKIPLNHSSSDEISSQSDRSDSCSDSETEENFTSTHLASAVSRGSSRSSLSSSRGGFSCAATTHDRCLRPLLAPCLKEQNGPTAADTAMAAVAAAEAAQAQLTRAALETELQQCEAAIVVAEQNSDGKGLTKALVNAGAAHKRLLQFEEAISVFKRALSLASSAGDTAAVAVACGHLGNVYMNMGKFEEAMEYHQICLTIRHQASGSYQAAPKTGKRVMNARSVTSILTDIFGVFGAGLVGATVVSLSALMSNGAA